MEVNKIETTDCEKVKTILVIEDEPIITDVCYRTLNGNGFEVDIAVNGKIALEKADKEFYSLYLVDIRTPEINGIEFFQWLKERHPDMANRVIFTTGDTVNREIMHFIEQSGRPILPKPFTPYDLQLTVRNSLISLGML